MSHEVLGFGSETRIMAISSGTKPHKMTPSIIWKANCASGNLAVCPRRTRLATTLTTMQYAKLTQRQNAAINLILTVPYACLAAQPVLASTYSANV